MRASTRMKRWLVAACLLAMTGQSSPSPLSDRKAAEPWYRLIDSMRLRDASIWAGAAGRRVRDRRYTHQ